MTQAQEPQELLVPIDEEGCERLLAASELGRLAVVVAGQPRIVVLNYAVGGPRTLLLRTRDDALIAQLTADGAAVPAAFEVDSIYPVGRTGWSVIATGSLSRESDPARAAAARAQITAWTRGSRDTVLRLDVAQLTGRRAGPD